MRAFFADLQAIEPRPRIFFGGLGEPLFHTDLVDWNRAGQSDRGNGGTDHQWHPADRRKKRAP